MKVIAHLTINGTPFCEHPLSHRYSEITCGHLSLAAAHRARQVIQSSEAEVREGTAHVTRVVRGSCPVGIGAMRYHVEVHTVSCAPMHWTGNSVEHVSAAKAEAAARDLFGRWTAVRYWRVIDDEGEVIASNLNS